jgi:hypothetical protein
VFPALIAVGVTMGVGAHLALQSRHCRHCRASTARPGVANGVPFSACGGVGGSSLPQQLCQLKVTCLGRGCQDVRLHARTGTKTDTRTVHARAYYAQSLIPISEYYLSITSYVIHSHVTADDNNGCHKRFHFITLPPIPPLLLLSAARRGKGACVPS